MNWNWLNNSEIIVNEEIEDGWDTEDVDEITTPGNSTTKDTHHIEKRSLCVIFGLYISETGERIFMVNCINCDKIEQMTASEATRRSLVIVSQLRFYASQFVFRESS